MVLQIYNKVPKKVGRVCQAHQDLANIYHILQTADWILVFSQQLMVEFQVPKIVQGDNGNL